MNHLSRGRKGNDLLVGTTLNVLKLRFVAVIIFFLDTKRHFLSIKNKYLTKYF